MRDLLAKYGLVENVEPAAAEQITTPGQQMIWGPPLGRTGTQTRGAAGPPRRMIRNWKSLLTFSESPIPNRAITLVCDRLASLDYEIGPKAEFANDGTDYSDEVDTIQRVMDDPNFEDEDWPTFLRQIVFDQLVFDFGCWEYVEKPDFFRENDLLSLCPVPGWSIERNALWNGDPNLFRWVQRQIGNNKVIPLLDKQLEVLILMKRTSRSDGLSPVEVSIGLMEAWLGLSSYQAQVASEAYPHFLISMGETTDQPLIDRMRAYWNLEIAGQGRPGIVGGFPNPTVLNLAPPGDEGLYLKYQEKLERTLAFSFRLKAMDFNIERDVNRSTAQTTAHQSLEEAVKPYAVSIQSRFNKRVIARLQKMTGNPKFGDLELSYDNIDPWDAKGEADILCSYMDRDGMTIGEFRQELGLDPDLPNGMQDMTISEYRANFKGAPLPLGDGEEDGSTSGGAGTDGNQPEPQEPGEPKASSTRRVSYSFGAARKKKVVSRRASRFSGKSVITRSEPTSANSPQQ